MAPVPVDITVRPNAADVDEEEIAFMNNVDDLSSTEVMLGCGNDNPY